jgi:hypothetical protein
MRDLFLDGAIILWTLLTVPLALFMAVSTDRSWVLIACLGGPIAFLVRRQPEASGTVLIAATLVLRLSFLGLIDSDPIEVSNLAAQRALAGENPYGVAYSGGPYPYGPLGLITYLAGIPGEVIGAVATSAILVWARAWLTLAVFNGWPQFVYMPIIGNNDFSVGFLTLFALVLLLKRPALGMAVLALSIAIKPYTAAWALPAAVYAGWSGAAVAFLVTLVAWSPVLFVWGLGSFVRSTLAAEALRGSLAAVPSWSFADAPPMRLLAVPAALAAFLFRGWRAVVLCGALAFVLFLGFAPRAPQPYLGFLVPIVGVAVESRLARDDRDSRVASSVGSH